MSLLDDIAANPELGADALVKWDRAIEAHPEAHVFMSLPEDYEWRLARGDANQYYAIDPTNVVMLWTVKLKGPDNYLCHFAYWWREDWFVRQCVPLATSSRWSPPGFPVAFESQETFQGRLPRARRAT